MKAEQKLLDDAQNFAKDFELLRKEIGKIVVGQNEIVEQLLISLFSKGHCILVGVPGLAKTLLIKTLAQCLNLSFNRIQFTPDLMPGDITGTEIIEEDLSTGKKSFRFIPGPLFAHIILADEINRTPPKTQAALLESMQEYQITAGGKRHLLEKPFFVLATHNPIEQEGTYPLPEAQLDRFMFNLWLDYPSFQEEITIVSQTTTSKETDVQPVLDAHQIISYQNLVREVTVPESVMEYTVNLVSKTRPGTADAPEFINNFVSWGAGPRASQYLILGSKARALSLGRYNINEEDIQHLALPVLRHRLVTNYAAEAEGLTPVSIIHRLIGQSG